MDYRVLVLALRLPLAAVTAVLCGLLIWLIGAVTVVQWIPHNTAVVTANLVIGMGLGAGLAAWFFGLHLGSNRRVGRYILTATVGLAIACAWLGQLLLPTSLYANFEAVRVKSATEIYGAITGAVVGAMVLPFTVGAWRAVHREEP